MFELDKNGPIVARRMRESAPNRNVFNVVVCHYSFGDSQPKNRTWQHRTLKAAFRRLSSVAAGKLYERDTFAAAIVTKEGNCMNWKEARAMLAAGQPQTTENQNA